MTEDPVAVVRAVHDAFNAREWDRMLELFAPDGVWKPALGPGGLEGDTYVGPEALRGWLASIAESWERFESTELTFAEVGDTAVLVLGRLLGKGAASGIDIDAPLVQLCEVRGGKVARLVSYPDREAALAAASALG